MGKRGPKPKGQYQNRTAVISTKITPELRDALKASADAGGAPLSGEIERRLRRSFDEDRLAIDHLGGRKIYAILRMIAGVLGMVGPSAYFTRHMKAGSTPDWLLDPYAYDQALKATVGILEGLRPQGDPTPPQHQVAGDEHQKRIATVLNEGQRNLGGAMAAHFLHLVADAAPGQPLPTDRLPKNHKLAQRIADELGPIAENLRRRSPAPAPRPVKSRRKK